MRHLLMRSGKSPFDVVDAATCLQRGLLGTNVGNLLFSDAAHKLLTTPGQDVTSMGIKTDPSPEHAARVNETYDVFVVPLANAFRPSFRESLDRLSRLIEQLTIPVVVLGVGAQTGTDYSTDRLDPIAGAVTRFARAVLERSASIGVRGELTADYLAGLGFTDVEVIGCPSMFLYGPRLPDLREPGAFGPDTRLAVNAAPASRPVGDVDGILGYAAERYPRMLYFAQNEADAALLLWGDTSPESGLTDPYPRYRTHRLAREGRIRVPLDPRNWLEDLRDRDFSYGPRLHGNVAALLAGTPAVLLAHDSRTLELSRYLGIPHRLLADTPADTDPERLYAEADFGPLYAGHRERFERFAAFLARNGLQNTFDDGDAGAGFEARWAARAPVPTLRSAWQGEDDGAVRYRVAALREQLVASRQANRALEATVARLQEQVATLRRGRAAQAERLDGLDRRIARLAAAMPAPRSGRRRRPPAQLAGHRRAVLGRGRATTG